MYIMSSIYLLKMASNGPNCAGINFLMNPNFSLCEFILICMNLNRTLSCPRKFICRPVSEQASQPTTTTSVTECVVARPLARHCSTSATQSYRRRRSSNSSPEMRRLIYDIVFLWMVAWWWWWWCTAAMHTIFL